MGARFEVLIEDVLMAPLDSRYTEVVFKLIPVQVCVGFSLAIAQSKPIESLNKFWPRTLMFGLRIN